MKSILFAFLAVFLLFSGCGPVTVNKPEPAKQPEKSGSVQIEEPNSTEITAPDSSLLAYGNLYFGMKKTEVESKNEPRQQLGKYEYNFEYSFNGDSALYRVIIKSEGVKVITFDTRLLALYNNLLQIVETRYGNPLKHNRFPSVFDVQGSGKYLLDRWEQGSKQIDILLRENALNSYSVLCEITNKLMAEAETTRLKNIRNKDVNDAAKKF